MSNLVGRKTIILGNDFIEHDIAAYIDVISVDNKTMLLRLDDPVRFTNVIYRYAVVSPRLEKNDFTELNNLKILGCSVTWIPDAKYDLHNPMNISWWRGGAAAIADIYIE